MTDPDERTWERCSEPGCQDGWVPVLESTSGDVGFDLCPVCRGRGWTPKEEKE